MKSQLASFALPFFIFMNFSLPTFGTSKNNSLNLLVIQTDEHHFKTLGCYGGKIVGTPNIDWIGNNGAICTSFYANHPRLLSFPRDLHERSLPTTHSGNQQQYSTR